MNLIYILRNSFLAGMMAVALTGCITDDFGPCPDDGTGTGGEAIPKETYYINLNVVAPTQPGSRAEGDENSSEENGGSTALPGGGSSSDDLPGATKENQLVSAHVYFCKNQTWEILADFESEYVAPVDETGKTTIRIKIDNINSLIKLAGQEDLKVLIVGNKKVAEGDLYSPTISNSDISKATFSVASLEANNRNIIGAFGSDGKNLPLVSAEAFTYPEPIDPAQDGVKTAEEIIKALFDRSTPSIKWWDVNKSNPIKLERAVARFEYRGKMSENEVTPESHIYNIDGIEGVNLMLYSMTPFNVNKDCYLFRHTSPEVDETWDSSKVNIFGKENFNEQIEEGGSTFSGYKWIANPWWTTKNHNLLNVFSIGSDSYLINGGNIGEAPGTVKINELTSYKSEEYNASTQKGGYHPWIYVTENTLYSQELMENDAEMVAHATGVAFKFKVVYADGKDIKFSTENTVNLPDAMAWSQETGKENYLEITDWSTGDWVQIAPDANDRCYYLDYMAYIVHNYNSTGMGPMYYGVVRNNTYQISIAKLNGLPNPKEPRAFNLELSINVLKWSSKENNFDF